MAEVSNATSREGSDSVVLLTGIGKQKVKVSTTLNRSIEFAAKNMFDEDVNTCWNSDQGEQQSVIIDFGRAVRVHRLTITFQGGFVGQVCWSLKRNCSNVAVGL
jgi:hypothetical protein